MSHRPLLERRSLMRLGAAGLIPEMLEEQGIRAEATFGRLGTSRQPLADPERVVPLAWLARVFKSAASATAQVEFGLLVGLRAGSRVDGGNRGWTSGDTHVRAALMRIISRPTTFPHSLLSLNVSGNTCTIECVGLPSNLIARDQLADCAIGFVAGALRVLYGPRWRPSGFRFAHQRPPDPSRQAALLQAPIMYDADVSAMEFGRTWLDHDDVAAPDARGEVHERRLHRDLVGEVRELIVSWSAVDRPSAPAVASELGLRPRTLNRLLGKQGTNFIRMREDARYESAQRLLRESAASVLSIAWSLGYADASAFSRAFRRWSGMTPSEWRQAAERAPL